MTPSEPMINTMLWFDHTEGRSIADKLARAVDHYVQVRYPGEMPTLCLVPAREDWGVNQIGSIRIQLSPALIMPGSFMLAQVVKSAAGAASQEVS